ncbi:MAG TPA: SgcJ/EcaC family oxidoreductase [Chitinophagaceae bacterium]|nr:SgcJ/EcaC family oxidoreductase [Chitinophagaceae bacterium]
MTNQVAIESATEAIMESIYEHLINAWNEANAEAFSELFSENGSMVGFDGSIANGRANICDHLSSIFANYRPGKFVAIIKEITVWSSNAGILRAVAGIVLPGRRKVNRGTNAIQSMVVANEAGHFRIALFQNTPAAFHGRPDLAEQLTTELQQQMERTNQETRH